MKVQETEFENYGKCVRITNGILDAVVTIEFGPRIIFFGFQGAENVLYEDRERSYALPCPKEGGGTFYYYGGHRLWLSPVRAAGFDPDDSPVVYSVLPEGVSFTAPKQKATEIQAGFEILMGEDASDIMVVHTAKNCSREAKNFGLWPATMLKGGGVAVLPQNTDGRDSLRPSRAIVLWPGTALRDGRVFYGDRFLTVRHEPENGAPLKIGVNDVLGWAAYAGEKYTLMKRYVHNPQAAYPDFGSSCEVCLRKDFAELESLSPLYRVEPGETIRHVENLSLFHTRNSLNPTDEDDIARYIKELQ